MFVACTETKSHLWIFVSVFSPGTLVYSTIKSDVTEILLLKVALNTLTLIPHYTTSVQQVNGDLRQVNGFLWVLWFPPPIKRTATIELKHCWKWR
jgi:hypothetical protein